NRRSTLFFSDSPRPPGTYALSLHDALPICPRARGSAARSSSARISACRAANRDAPRAAAPRRPQSPAPPVTFRTGTETSRPAGRSEEHTSELQSRENLVCRLLLEKKNKY